MINKGTTPIKEGIGPSLFLRAVTIFSFVILTALIPIANAQDGNHFHNLGIELFNSGEYEASIDPLEWALEEGSRFADTFIYLASAYVHTGRYSDAAALASRGLEEYPLSIKLYALKAEAYSHYDITSIIPVYENLLLILHDHPDKQTDFITINNLKNSLGNIHENIGNEHYFNEYFDDAIESFYQSIKYTPHSISVTNNLVYLLYKKERFEEAKEVLDKSKALVQSNESLMYLSAQVALAIGDQANALEMFRQLHEASPNDLDRAIAFGISLYNNNNIIEANDLFNELLKKFPKERHLYQTLIEINRKRMDYEGVNRILDLKIQAFPDERRLLNKYGQSLMTLLRYNESFTWYDSLSVAFNDHEFARSAAHSLLHNDDMEHSEEYYQNLLRKWPDNPAILREAGLLFEKHGDKGLAKTLIQDYAGISQDGRFLVKSFLYSDNSAEKKKYLEKALSTEYAAVAEWHKILKDEGKLSDKKNDIVATISRMILSYSELYQDTRFQVKEQSEHLSVSTPYIFQLRAELEEYEQFIKNALATVIQIDNRNVIMAVFQELMDYHPDSALLFYKKGLFLYRFRDYENATELLNEAIRLGASDPELYLNLAESYYKSRNYDMAIFSFEQVIALDYSDPRPYRKIIDISEGLGSLSELCDRWLSRYHHNKNNTVLRDFLIEALHKADRYEEAKLIINS